MFISYQRDCSRLSGRLYPYWLEVLPKKPEAVYSERRLLFASKALISVPDVIVIVRAFRCCEMQPFKYVLGYITEVVCTTMIKCNFHSPRRGVVSNGAYGVRFHRDHVHWFSSLCRDSGNMRRRRSVSCNQILGQI